jgi:hypothetical protein
LPPERASLRRENRAVDDASSAALRIRTKAILFVTGALVALAVAVVGATIVAVTSFMNSLGGSAWSPPSDAALGLVRQRLEQVQLSAALRPPPGTRLLDTGIETHCQDLAFDRYPPRVYASYEGDGITMATLQSRMQRAFAGDGWKLVDAPGTRIDDPRYVQRWYRKSYGDWTIAARMALRPRPVAADVTANYEGAGDCRDWVRRED